MTSLSEEVTLLRTVPFFATLEAGKLKLLAYSSERLGFQAGEVVFRQGAGDGDAYFILDGEADVLTETHGQEIRVAHLPRHALFGEISAFCGVPRTATVRAHGTMTALRIPKDYFLELVTDTPEVALQVIRVLARRVADTTADLVAALERAAE